MDKDTIELDGSVMLADLAATGGDGGEALEHRRESRLNDVMIVLERDARELESRLAARFAALGLPITSGDVELTFDDRGPALLLSVAASEAADGGPQQLARHVDDLGREAASELVAAIERRAAQTRQFRPVVHFEARGRAEPQPPPPPSEPPRTADTSPDESLAGDTARPRPPNATAPASKRPRNSLWLQLLFVLIAAVLFVAGYLFISQFR